MTTIYVGLSVGAVYALMALGYNITLTQSGIFNFAYAATVVLGLFLAWFVVTDLGWAWPLAVLIGAAAGALAGWFVELIAVRPLGNRRHGHAVLVTIVGASVIIEGLIFVLWGSDARSLAFFGGNEPFELLGGRLQAIDVALVVLAIVLAVGLHTAHRRTSWGLSGRATTLDPELAAARGVNTQRLLRGGFIISGAMGGALGPILAPKIGVDLAIAVSLTIYGFVALVIGGIGSYLGTLAGGLIVGLIYAVSSRYLGFPYPPLVLFAVLMAVLMVRPSGLFGDPAVRGV